MPRGEIQRLFQPALADRGTSLERGAEVDDSRTGLHGLDDRARELPGCRARHLAWSLRKNRADHHGARWTNRRSGSAAVGAKNPGDEGSMSACGAGPMLAADRLVLNHANAGVCQFWMIHGDRPVD